MAIGKVELSFPSDKSMMLVLRLTAAGVLARAGLTVDVMDDVKLAVEEACNCLIGQECPPERILCTFEREERNLEIAVSALARETGKCGMEEDELRVVRAILESMVSSVEIDQTGGWIRKISMKVALN